MAGWLEFEKPLLELEQRIDELRSFADGQNIDVAKELSRYVERVYGLSFGVRVGVDFGEVVFGVMGAGSSARETVIGDTVNVASRLESANKDTGTDMLISDAVYQLTGDAVTVGKRHELDVRGKLGPVIAYDVLSAET